MNTFSMVPRLKAKESDTMLRNRTQYLSLKISLAPELEKKKSQISFTYISMKNTKNSDTKKKILRLLSPMLRV